MGITTSDSGGTSPLSSRPSDEYVDPNKHAKDYSFDEKRAYVAYVLKLTSNKTDHRVMDRCMMAVRGMKLSLFAQWEQEVKQKPRTASASTTVTQTQSTVRDAVQQVSAAGPIRFPTLYRERLSEDHRTELALLFKWLIRNPLEAIEDTRVNSSHQVICLRLWELYKKAGEETRFEEVIPLERLKSWKNNHGAQTQPINFRAWPFLEREDTEEGSPLSSSGKPVSTPTHVQIDTEVLRARIAARKKAEAEGKPVIERAYEAPADEPVSTGGEFAYMRSSEENDEERDADERNEDEWSDDENEGEFEEEKTGSPEKNENETEAVSSPELVEQAELQEWLDKNPPGKRSQDIHKDVIRRLLYLHLQQGKTKSSFFETAPVNYVTVYHWEKEMGPKTDPVNIKEYIEKKAREDEAVKKKIDEDEKIRNADQPEINALTAWLNAHREKDGVSFSEEYHLVCLRLLFLHLRNGKTANSGYREYGLNPRSLSLWEAKYGKQLEQLNFITIPAEQTDVKNVPTELTTDSNVEHSNTPLTVSESSNEDEVYTPPTTNPVSWNQSEALAFVQWVYEQTNNGADENALVDILRSQNIRRDVFRALIVISQRTPRKRTIPTNPTSPKVHRVSSSTETPDAEPESSGTEAEIIEGSTEAEFIEPAVDDDLIIETPSPELKPEAHIDTVVEPKETPREQPLPTDHNEFLQHPAVVEKLAQIEANPVDTLLAIELYVLYCRASLEQKFYSDRGISSLLLKADQQPETLPFPEAAIHKDAVQALVSKGVLWCGVDLRQSPGNILSTTERLVIQQIVNIASGNVEQAAILLGTTEEHVQNAIAVTPAQ